MVKVTSERNSNNNAVSEWFGHRVFPAVSRTPRAILDQQEGRCPFLSAATGEKKLCIKAPTSLGICTISSRSNGLRQDWLVCPYRALDSALVENVSRRLFSIHDDRT